MKVWDVDSSPGTVCWDINCTLLPVGYVLLLVDSYFDIRWVVWPSPKTKRAVQQYYINLLTPGRIFFLFPGYWFPLYVIFKMCGQCPTAYNYMLLALFGLVSIRYVGVLRGTDVQLRHWWTVLVTRVLLAMVTTLDIRALQCKPMWTPQQYAEHLTGFLWSEQS